MRRVIGGLCGLRNGLGSGPEDRVASAQNGPIHQSGDLLCAQMNMLDQSPGHPAGREAEVRAVEEVGRVMLMRAPASDQGRLVRFTIERGEQPCDVALVTGASLAP